MDRIAFLKESLRTIWTTGAIAPSSKFLVKEMMKPIDFDTAHAVVELGAGNGVMTKAILKQMRPDARLLCFEINPEFCRILRAINDPRLVLIEDSAAHLLSYMSAHGIAEIDCVVSAIPFMALPKELSYEIVGEAHKSLKNKGLFVQFHYSTTLQKMYKSIFGNIRTQFVPLNIPPAFVMVCEKHSV